MSEFRDAFIGDVVFGTARGLFVQGNYDLRTVKKEFFDFRKSLDEKNLLPQDANRLILIIPTIVNDADGILVAVASSGLDSANRLGFVSAGCMIDGDYPQHVGAACERALDTYDQFSEWSRSRHEVGNFDASFFDNVAAGTGTSPIEVRWRNRSGNFADYCSAASAGETNGGKRPALPVSLFEYFAAVRRDDYLALRYAQRARQDYKPVDDALLTSVKQDYTLRLNLARLKDKKRMEARFESVLREFSNLQVRLENVEVHLGDLSDEVRQTREIIASRPRQESNEAVRYVDIPPSKTPQRRRKDFFYEEEEESGFFDNTWVLAVLMVAAVVAVIIVGIAIYTQVW